MYPKSEQGGELAVLVFLVASAAVDRTIVPGNEGNLAGGTTVRANCVMHFTIPVALALHLVPAILAANGLVLETLLCVEFLFACGEGEFSAAILANECLVFEHVFVFPFSEKIFDVRSPG